jgi:hypothetical protein
MGVGMKKYVRGGVSQIGMEGDEGEREGGREEAFRKVEDVHFGQTLFIPLCVLRTNKLVRSRLSPHAITPLNLHRLSRQSPQLPAL